MDINIVVDKNGDTMRVKHYDGVNYFLTGTEGRHMKTLLTQMRGYVSKQDDVLIASYPKSGTNWVNCIVYMLINNKAENPEENIVFINALSREEFSNMPSPRQVISHFLFRYFPKDIIDKNVKIINVIRNPKDTTVSMYNFLLKCRKEEYNGTWDGFLDMFLNGDSLFGSWFTYVKEWEDARQKHPGHILQVKYEDLIFDLGGNIKKIADFLEIPCDEKFLHDIKNKSSFISLKNSHVAAEFWKTHSYDGKNPVWRKGEVGDWKNWFTVSQNDLFNRRLQEEMKGYSIQFRYE